MLELCLKLYLRFSRFQVEIKSLVLSRTMKLCIYKYPFLQRNVDLCFRYNTYNCACIKLKVSTHERASRTQYTRREKSRLLACDLIFTLLEQMIETLLLFISISTVK